MRAACNVLTFGVETVSSRLKDATESYNYNVPETDAHARELHRETAESDYGDRSSSPTAC